MGSLYVVDDLKFIPRNLAHINLSGSFIVFPLRARVEPSDSTVRREKVLPSFSLVCFSFLFERMNFVCPDVVSSSSTVVSRPQIETE